MTLNTNGEQSVSGATVETVLPNFLFVLEVWENGPSFSHNLGKWSDTSPVCTLPPQARSHHPSPDTASLDAASLALFQSFLHLVARATFKYMN